MALKKNDKIIAIIGVIILIVAAIGVVFYASSEKESSGPVEEIKQIKTFEVNYTEVSLPINPDNTDFTIKPKLFGVSKYFGEIILDEPNLKSLDIWVDYHDNKAGIFFNKWFRFLGADTLTIIIYEDGQEIINEMIKGDGYYVEMPSISIGSVIPVLTIEANDTSEAMELLKEQYIDYNLTYNIEISLKTGLWKKIREMFGKDSFDLRINYTQFVYDIISPEDDTNDEYPPTSENEYGTQTWAVMSYPGKT